MLYQFGCDQVAAGDYFFLRVDLSVDDWRPLLVEVLRRTDPDMDEVCQACQEAEGKLLDRDETLATRLSGKPLLMGRLLRASHSSPTPYAWSSVRSLPGWLSMLCPNLRGSVSVVQKEEGRDEREKGKKWEGEAGLELPAAQH